MSNARSPREVCSTTIGTSGLTVLASFRFVGSNPPGAPSAALALARARSGESSNRSGPLRKATGIGPWTDLEGGARLRSRRRPAARRRPRRPLLLGRPELLARLGLLDGDRRRGLGDRGRRPGGRRGRAQRVQAAGLAQPLEQLLGRGALALRPRARAPRARSSSDGSMRLGLDDRGEHRLAAQRLLGVGLGLLEDLLLGAARDLQVGLARDALVRERVQRLVPHLLRRAPRRASSGTSTVALGDGGVERGLAELASISRVSASRDPRADVLAQLVERVEAGLGRRSRRRARAAAWP